MQTLFGRSAQRHQVGRNLQRVGFSGPALRGAFPGARLIQNKLDAPILTGSDVPQLQRFADAANNCLKTVRPFALNPVRFGDEERSFVRLGHGLRLRDQGCKAHLGLFSLGGGRRLQRLKAGHRGGTGPNLCYAPMLSALVPKPNLTRRSSGAASSGPLQFLVNVAFPAGNPACRHQENRSASQGQKDRGPSFNRAERGANQERSKRRQ